MTEVRSERADVSAMLLVKDDAHVLVTIAQLRPHVAEVIVGWTPNEELTAEMLRAAGVDVVVEVTGPLRDWATARNAVLRACTRRYLLWADSDDDVEGLERLPEALALLDAHPLARLLCPYDYAVDAETGGAELRQWRERVVRNDGRFEWRYPCHEVLVAKDGRYGEPGEREPRAPFLVWKHRREDQPESLGQQEEMIRAYLDAHPGDPWGARNLGTTLMHLRRPAEAIPLLTDYVEKSGWDDERCTVMLDLARAELQVAGIGGDDSRAMAWVERAIDLRPAWFEPHFEAGKIWYVRAVLKGDARGLRAAVAAFREARTALPTTDHPFAAHPRERAFHVHDLERQARADLGDWGGAIAAGLRSVEGRVPRADDRRVMTEVRKYGAFLALEKAAGAAAVARGDGLDVVFACGRSWYEWNPAVHAEKGLGGSETAVVEMARRLAARGHRVRVYCNCGGDGLYDGVEYRDVDLVKPGQTGECDVLVAWRDARQLGFAPARARLLWVHDVEAANMGPRWWVRADRVLALSEWHRRNLLEKHELAESHVVRTRNGIDVDRFTMAPLSPEPVYRVDPDGTRVNGQGYRRVGRDQHRAIWSSSGDRGLQVLLDVWPAVRERVPDATLAVAYGLDLWKEVAERSGSEQQRYAVLSLERRLRGMAGVEYIGAVDQGTLAREMLASGVWIGSLWFTETSCIGAMEAQAAGCRLVAGAKAALPETIGERGVLIDGDWLSDGYQERLVDAVVAALTQERGEDRSALQAYAHRAFDWEGVAEEWCSMMAEVVREADAGAMPEFRRLA